MTLRARFVASVLRELYAHVDLVLLRLEPFKEAFDAVPLRASLVEKIPFRWRQIVDRDVESQFVFLRGALEVFVAVFVSRRVPRRDRKLIEAQAAIRNHLLHVDPDDPAIALAIRASAQRRVEREKLRRRLEKLGPAFVARESRREPMAHARVGALLEHVAAAPRDFD